MTELEFTVSGFKRHDGPRSDKGKRHKYPAFREKPYTFCRKPCRAAPQRQRKNHERTKAQAYTDTLWFKLVVSYFAFQYAGVEIILYKKTEPIVSKEIGEKLPPSAA